MRSYAVRLDCLLLLRNGSIWVMSMAAKDVHAKVFIVSYECGLGDRCRPAGTAQKRRRWLGFMGSALDSCNFQTELTKVSFTKIISLSAIRALVPIEFAQPVLWRVLES